MKPWGPVERGLTAAGDHRLVAKPQEFRVGEAAQVVGIQFGGDIEAQQAQLLAIKRGGAGTQDGSASLISGP